MVDLGETIGSMMTGVIKARRMADEQTAALAEYYRSQPLLANLSVPRIRIPELTIEMPFTIEDFSRSGEPNSAEMDSLIQALAEILGSTLKEKKFKNSALLTTSFKKELESKLQNKGISVESTSEKIIEKAVKDSLENAESETNTHLPSLDRVFLVDKAKSVIASMIRTKQAAISSIEAGILSQGIKDRANEMSVVKLKITLKEEGLEWITQTSEAGVVTRTLQEQ